MDKNNEKINSKEFRSILGDIKSTALEFIESLDRSIIEQREIMSVEKDYEKKTSNEAQSALKNSFANDGKEVEKRIKYLKIKCSIETVIYFLKMEILTVIGL